MSLVRSLIQNPGQEQAITDTSCTVFYRELVEAYPEAKVVLTVRDSVEQWYESQIRTIVPFFAIFVDPPSTLYECIYRLFLPRHPADRMNVLLLRYSVQRCVGQWTQVYKDDIAEIQKIVPKEKLPVMNVKEGWEPLCAISGEKIPDWKFRVNDKQSFIGNSVETEKILNRVVMMNAAITVGAAMAIVVGLVVACRRSVFM